MSHPDHLLQVIAEQRQAELIAAAEQYRLARPARAAADAFARGDRPSPHSKRAAMTGGVMALSYR